MAQQQGAEAALPVLLIVREVATVLHAAHWTKDVLWRRPSMHRVGTHAVGRAVLLVIGEGGELAVGGERADQCTMATATVSTGLYLEIDPVDGIVGHSKDVKELIDRKSGCGRTGQRQSILHAKCRGAKGCGAKGQGAEGCGAEDRGAED